jgi:hypothetical protein
MTAARVLAVAPAPGRTAALRGSALFRRWTVVVAAGETIGFLAPALVGVLATSAPATVAVPLIMTAGTLEGAVLGAAQHHVLGQALPGLRRGRWVTLTAAAAAAAYLLGMSITPLAALGSWPAMLAVACLAVLLLLTIGAAQTLELRHHVRHAGRWIAWTAGAWLLGLGIFLAVATPLWHAGQSTAAAVVVGVAAGTLMATAQAAVTGYGLLRLLPDPTRNGSAHHV